MLQQARDRDCVVLTKGDCYPVAVDLDLLASGWTGGQGVMWSTSTADEFIVKRSDGLYSGFLLWGSNESGDLYTNMTRQQPHYKYAIMGAGGWMIMTTSYERYTWASRVAHQLNPLNPLVPLVYQGSDRLLFSLRGIWTIEDEWSLAGDPRAPNSYYIGFVCQAPAALNNFYMTVQVSI